VIEGEERPISRVAQLPMVVRVEKDDPPSRTDALEAAALAALRVWREPIAEGLADEAVLESWLPHPRKVVRRARAGAWAQLAAIAPVHVQVRTAEVLGFAVTWTDELPKILSRLPVTGTDLHDPAPPPPPAGGAAVLWLSPLLEISAGKAMAQAGHGSLLVWETLDEQARKLWADAGTPLAVRVPAAADWDRLAHAGLPLVQDAGHTEIRAGSVTVVVEVP